ncbi:hypothetical protein BDZ94DRAFT_1326376, partial [Collybia nuda]
MSLKLNVEVKRTPASALHYHRCHIASCLRDNMGRDPNIKILPCPCAEVFYCSKECQTKDWKWHKQECYDRLRRKKGIRPFDDEVIFMLKHLDTALVEMTIAAMGNDADLDMCAETHAAVIFLAPMPADGEFPKPTFQLQEGFVKAIKPKGGWSEKSIKPFIVEKVELRTQMQETKRLGMEGDFFESPAKKQWRLRGNTGAHSGLLNIAMVFEPTGRGVSKDVPRSQLQIWETVQKNCKTRVVPPRLPYLVYTTNVRINTTLAHEQEKRDGDHPSNAANARVCKQWSEVAFDHLWKDITDIYVLFSRLSPLKIYKSSWSPPDYDSWADFTKINKRVRTLCYEENTQDNIHHSVFDDIARTRITFNFLPNLHTLEWLGDVNHCVMFMHKNVQNFYFRIPNGLTFSETRGFFRNIKGRMPDLIGINIRMDASVRGIEGLMLTLLRGLPKLQNITLPLFWLTSKLTECLSNHLYLPMIDFEYGPEQGEGKLEDVVNFKPSLNHGAFPLLRDLSFCNPFNKTIIYSHNLETRETFQQSIITITNNLKALTSLSLISLFNPRGPPPSPEACININDIIP